MEKMLKRKFSLTEKGANDLVKAVKYTIIFNLFLMGTSTLSYWYLYDSTFIALDNKIPEFNFIKYILGFIILFVGIYISYFYQYNACFFASYEESGNKRISLAEKIRKLPLSFFGKKDLSDITATIMTDTAILEEGFSHYIPELIGSFVSTTLIGIGLFIFNFKMAIALLWVIPLSIILCCLTKKVQDTVGIKTKEIQLSYTDKIQECIENIRDIKANNRKDAHIKIVEKKLKDYEKSTIFGECLTGIFVNLSQMLLKLGIGTTMIVGIILLVSNEINILTFLIFMMVATRIFDPLSASLINLAAIFITFLSVDRMKKLENTKVQLGNKSISNKGYDIEFENVDFSYNEGKKIIDNISFVAKQGEVTALVGPSGGGKSTTIKLAARFWDINGGKITLGGEDISKIDPETLLKNYSIVFQDINLFNNTVMENIRIGRKNATDDEVIEASKQANCHEFIMKMPEGYNTFIGENGGRLSGGERQRMSIARALLKDAPIILLDEATSSLDIKTESAIQEAISKLIKNKTVIVIAHRMRTIVNADKIVFLRDGKISEIGVHRELMARKGDYSSMIKLQLSSLNWKI